MSLGVYCIRIKLFLTLKSKLTQILLISLFLVIGLSNSYLEAAQIEKVESHIVLGSNGKHKVMVSYHLDELVSPAAFKLLLFEGNEVLLSEITMNETPQPFDIINETSELLEGVINISSGGNHLEITYMIHSTQQGDLIIPMLLLEATPPEVQDGAFQCVVNYPESLNLTNQFPLVPWEVRSGEASFEMQVIPSVIRIQLSSNDSPLISSTALIDILVIISLVVISWMGWRQLKMVNQ